MTDPNGKLQVVLAQFEARLKDQHLRVEHRLKLVTFNLTVSGALMALSLNNRDPRIMLLVPLVSSIFGLMVVYNVRAEHEIGDFIRDNLNPHFQKVIGDSEPLWDTHRTLPPKRFLKELPIVHVPTLGAFLIPAVASLGLFYEQRHHPDCGVMSHILFRFDIVLVVYMVLTYVVHTAWPKPKQPQSKAPRPSEES